MRKPSPTAPGMGSTESWWRAIRRRDAGRSKSRLDALCRWSTAAIFWLKTKGGWREIPQSHQVAHYDLSRFTDEELEQILSW